MLKEQFTKKLKFSQFSKYEGKIKSQTDLITADLFTSQLGENVDLLVQDLFQLSRKRLDVVVDLLRHLQQHLLILQPADGLL